MLYQIHGNPKHGSDTRTAFLEQLRNYHPEWIGIVAGPNDLIDPDGPIALSNLPINTYHLRLVNVVKYVNGLQLWPVPGTTMDDLPVVNTPMIAPDHSGNPRGLPASVSETVGEEPVVEAGQTD